VGEEVFVIPLSAVAECLELPTEARSRAEAVGVLNLRGHALPYARLGAFFGRSAPPRSRENVVVVHDHVGRAGLVVDTLLGERQAVIKPLGRLVRGARGVSGATILGDGRVALILDVPSVLRRLLASATAPAA
jgi:two-component system chemotaxis sensor kinase CheA